MIDTHSHLLPGVDDGSPGLEQSLQMAREAVANGTTEVVCTPHLRDPASEVVVKAKEVLEELRSSLDRSVIPLRLRLGFEVDATVVGLLEPHDLRSFTIEGTAGLILVEMPHYGLPAFLEEALFKLRATGLQPVLAHPERNDRVQQNPELLDRLVASGGCVQGTAASLTGEFGARSKRMLLSLLAQGTVAVLGTDAHFDRRSTWSFHVATQVIERHIPAVDLALLVEENPRRLLRDQTPTTVKPSPRAKWWRGSEHRA